jgi:hypothetical protein
MAPSDPERLVAALLRSRWLMLFATALVAGLLITASVGWRDNRFMMEATTRRITVTAARRAEHDVGIRLPPDAELRVTGYEVADPPNALRELFGTGRPVVLRGEGIVLTSIVLDRGGELTVATPNAERLELEFGAAARIAVSLGGAVSAGGSDDTVTQVGVFRRSEPLAASAKLGTGNPLRIVIAFPTGTLLPFTLRDQPLSGLSFARPRASTAETRFPFRSELVKGTLSMLDTGSTETLRPGELVWLHDIAAHLVLLDATPDGILVDVSGEAGQVGLGPPRGEGWRPDRDLTPSVFAYLAGQHELKLIWGVAVVVLGALWRARQWARKPGGQ